MRRTRPRPALTAEPQELAAGYMFPELFDDAPCAALLPPQLVEASPWQPAEAVQQQLPGMPPIDWEHVRAQQAANTSRVRRQPSAQLGIAGLIAPVHGDRPVQDD
ncbi:MAG: hypothetical protein IPO81_00215 [Kouleothrix sp.]|nr:hypothetical protein [Kouleothrix sp.]